MSNTPGREFIFPTPTTEEVIELKADRELDERALERPIVDAAFFPDGRFVSQYLINIGYGDDTQVWPRLPRFEAHDIAQYV
jgi:hypothetical protein